MTGAILVVAAAASPLLGLFSHDPAIIAGGVFLLRLSILYFLYGLARAIDRHKAPWHVVRVGARVEFICAPGPLKNSTQAGFAHQPQVEAALHTGLFNRGTLIAPFHNMTLVCPATTTAQVDHLIATVGSCIDELQH